MRVIVPEYAGVCYGVERAIKLAQEAAAQDEVVHTLGPLIHNPQAVAEMEESGINVAKTLEEVEGGKLVIRTHGVPPEIIAAARAKGLEVIDATCPHVSKAQAAAAQLAEQGYSILIVGEANHPEIVGILACTNGKAIVVDSPEAVPDKLPTRRVGIVVQTTQSNALLQSVVDKVLPLVGELRIHNTICSATGQRQDSAYELAGKVDAMVVVGGRNSGNTTRLVEICQGACDRVYHVETADELGDLDFSGCEVVGVTAGASTPGPQIQGVIEAIEAM